MNRKLHRWTSLPIVLFMFIIAVSGVWLQFYEFEEAGEGRHGRSRQVALPADAEVSSLVGAALAAARAQKPDLPIRKIEIEFGDPAPKVVLGNGDRRGAKVEYDGATSSAKFVPPPPMSMRGLMIQLHTGRIGGFMGLIVVMLGGLILTLLSVTGAMVYFEMWKARRAAGRKGLFW